MEGQRRVQGRTQVQGPPGGVPAAATAAGVLPARTGAGDQSARGDPAVKQDSPPVGGLSCYGGGKRGEKMRAGRFTSG
ncbi:hypothetical protein CBM2599_A50042 [Cupriavidus taiwanensis]|nr:hypothetical protein CBM2599_A50042 [Cupriavidus taiwanensis]